MTILGKRLKIVHCRNCLFFVPKDNKDFHRVLVEKSVKIGRKTYQAHPASPEDDPDFPKSAVDDRKKKNKVSGPSMVEVAPSFGTSSAAVRPSQLFIGKDEEKGVTPTHELPENSGSALRVDGKLFLRMLERVEVLETNIAKIAHVIDREASSSQSSNVSEPLDVDRSDVVGSATVQTDIADYLTKGKDSNSPLYSLQALYPEELYDTVFPVLSQPLLRLLRTYASRDPELKDFARTLRGQTMLGRHFIPKVGHHINVGSLNVQSLTAGKKIGVVKLMEQENCHILCLQETWSPGPLRTDNRLGKTYHSIGVHREHRSRGIGILVDPHLNFTVVQSLCWATVDGECLTLRSHDGGLVSNVYIPPQSEVGLGHLFDVISTTEPAYPYWLIVGDFNANHADWSMASPNRNGTLMAEFLEDHIEFVGCFPDFATYESGDKCSVVDFGLLSSKVDLTTIAWKRVDLQDME